MAVFSLKANSYQAKDFPEYDVIIIGSGSGGGLAAAEMAKKGYRVALIEMGANLRTKDFKLDESFAYQNLYQEAAGRKTKDGLITVLQGKALGGGTTVNWTSSFRTPDLTLKYWEEHFGLKEAKPEVMKPYFEQVEKIIDVTDWEIEPNRNNSLLAEGLKSLGHSYGLIRRNVKSCQNLGYCGFGCPVGAKQSGLLTTIKEAELFGADIFCDAFVQKIAFSKKKLKNLAHQILIDNSSFGIPLKLRAKTFILSAGAIGTPAIMKRSGFPDPYDLVGKRTFLHPVVISGGVYDEEVEPFYGAPQTVYSDDFLPKNLVEKQSGFKLEVPPIHPLLISTTLPFYGQEHRKFMESLPNLQAILALQRDGFHPESPGGMVQLTSNGGAVLDYRITPYMQDGFRRALEVMGEVQFAAGAKEVMPLHKQAKRVKKLSELRQQLKNLSMKSQSLKVVSAHVMGGCPMGNFENKSVVNENGKHHHIDNVYVMDGSIFPTSIGTNPMVSILSQTLRMINKFNS